MAQNRCRTLSHPLVFRLGANRLEKRTLGARFFHTFLYMYKMYFLTYSFFRVRVRERNSVPSVLFSLRITAMQGTGAFGSESRDVRLALAWARRAIQQLCVLSWWVALRPAGRALSSRMAPGG